MNKTIIGAFVVLLALAISMSALAKGGTIAISSTRAEVIAAYGQPTGNVTSGDEEILSYAQGMISLKNGAVVYIDPEWGKRPAKAAPAKQATTPSKESSADRDWFGREKKQEPTRADAQDVKIFALKGQQIDLRTVLEPGKVTIVDFYADWCGPCRRIAPELERLATSDPDVVLRKVDIVNWETPVVQQFGIRSVPNIRVYDRNGTMVGSPTSSLQEVKNNIERAK